MQHHSLISWPFFITLSRLQPIWKSVTAAFPCTIKLQSARSKVFHGCSPVSHQGFSVQPIIGASCARLQLVYCLVLLAASTGPLQLDPPRLLIQTFVPPWQKVIKCPIALGPAIQTISLFANCTLDQQIPNRKHRFYKQASRFWSFGLTCSFAQIIKRFSKVENLTRPDQTCRCVTT